MGQSVPAERGFVTLASHCDLYDGGYEEKAGQGQPKNMIPWDTLAEFFTNHLIYKQRQEK